MKTRKIRYFVTFCLIGLCWHSRRAGVSPLSQTADITSKKKAVFASVSHHVSRNQASFEDELGVGVRDGGEPRRRFVRVGRKVKALCQEV